LRPIVIRCTPSISFGRWPALRQASSTCCSVVPGFHFTITMCWIIVGLLDC